MWESIKKMLLQLLWPVIKDLFRKLIRELLDWLVKRLKEVFDRSNSRDASEAESKAGAAEEKARSSTTKEEAAEHEATAKAWREVAEMFRRKNEDLTRELEELRQHAASRSEMSISRLVMDEVIESAGDEVRVVQGQPILRLDDRSQK